MKSRGFGLIVDQEKGVRVTSLLRALSDAQGRESERHFFRVVSGMVFPVWLDSIIPATQEQDLCEGIDFVAKTDIGDIPIQIKSSRLGLKNFVEGKHKGRYDRDIFVFIVRGTDSPERVRSVFLQLFSRWRRKLMRCRSKLE